LTKSLHFLLKRLPWVPHRLSDLQKWAWVTRSKELLKPLEKMRDHSWKYIAPLGEAGFYLPICLLITNRFGSIEKMKLHKGRVISEDDADGRLERTRVSLP
jgi:hypothetical protein